MAVSATERRAREALDRNEKRMQTMSTARKLRIQISVSHDGADSSRLIVETISGAKTLWSAGSSRMVARIELERGGGDFFDPDAARSQVPGTRQVAALS
jgi:hypothetical protein